MDMNLLKSRIVQDLTKTKTLFKTKKRSDGTESSSCKNSQLSDVTREEGNKLLERGSLDKKQLHKVLRFYNKSIAHALVGSEEMAKAYANKSALLLHMRKYNACISEIEKALTITKLISLKVKLLCRKTICLTAMGSSDNRSCLEKARFVLSKSEDSASVKETLMKFIEKAELVVNEGKLDAPKENKRMLEVSKIVADEEKKDIWKSIEMRHSKKYGKHVVAARDFGPGEIILVEKPYLNHVGESRTYQYCHSCFSYLWTVVPCNHCSFCMFCSKECRDKAWREYHDLECSVASRMKEVFREEWDVISILLTVFFKVFKETGSVKKLRSDCESLAHEDKCSNKLTYKTMLTATTLDIRQENIKGFITSPVITLIGLAKFTTIFGKTYDFNEIDKLMKNDEAIFVGCLLLKLIDVIGYGCSNVKLYDPTVCDGSYQEVMQNSAPDHDGDAENRLKCTSFNIVTMLTLTGCIPNIEITRTIGHKSVMFTLQPIKAGTPLIAFYKSVFSIYHHKPKLMRQLAHHQFYKTWCDCRACTEDWPESINDSSLAFQHTAESNSQEFAEYIGELKSIWGKWEPRITAHKPNYPDIKAVSKVKKFAEDTWKYFSLPSAPVMVCTNFVLAIMRSFHDPDKNMFTTS